MLKSKKFWSYDLCQTSQLRQELFDNYKIKGKFYEDVLYFYKEITEVTSISFINSKVDLNTLKILIHLLPYSKIVSLKFCTNNFDINNLEYLIDSILTKQNNVFFFSYEWNDKLSIEDKVLSITSQLDEINIEHLHKIFLLFYNYQKVLDEVVKFDINHKTKIFYFLTFIFKYYLYKIFNLIIITNNINNNIILNIKLITH